MAQRHSTPVRGLMSTKNSILFQGPFGRLFRSLPPATFGSTEAENVKNLTLLGQKMSASFDPPKDGKDEEESGIPALFRPDCRETAFEEMSGDLLQDDLLGVCTIWAFGSRTTGAAQVITTNYLRTIYMQNLYPRSSPSENQYGT
jgi:hypothetical protein